MPEASVQAPYSIVFIGGPDGDIPETLAGLVSTTPTCVAVGTLCSDDGPTMVKILEATQAENNHPELLAWQGIVNVPDGVLMVQSAECDTYLEYELKGKKTNLQIYVNHEKEPDEIVILVKTTP